MSSVSVTARRASSGCTFFLTKIFVISLRAIANRGFFFASLISKCFSRNRSRLAYGSIRLATSRFLWIRPARMVSAWFGSTGLLKFGCGDLTRPPPSNPENLRVACLNLLAHPFHRHGILFHNLDLAERLAAGLLPCLQVLRR